MTSPFSQIPIKEHVRSSRILALVNPRKYGLEIVKVRNGKAYRYARYQGVVISGEFVVLLGMKDTFVPHRFDYVENGVLHLTSIKDIPEEP